jgi:CheY-like chemotaxis protein
MICKTIVEAHGGCTVLRSELGKGSCFSIILRASPPGIPESVPELMVRASSTTTFTRALNWSFKTSSKVNPANVRPHCVKPEGCGDNTDRSFTTSPDSEPGANCVAGREPLKPTGPVVQHLKGLRALIVDDSALNRRLLGAGLQRDGVQVTDAADGLEAVEMTIASMGSRCPFHVIFMDYTMERLDGPSATRRIRQELGFIGMILGVRRAAAHTACMHAFVPPCIPARLHTHTHTQVTGNVSQVDKDSFLSAGANDVLGKPVDFGTIRSILLPIAGAVAAAKERLFLSTV